MFNAYKVRSIFKSMVGDDGKLINGRFYARVVSCRRDYEAPRRRFDCAGHIIDEEIHLRKGECFCFGAAVSSVDAALEMIRNRGAVACSVGCGSVKRRIGNFIVCYSKEKFAYVSVEVLSKKG